MAKENAPLSRKEEEEKKAAEAQQQSGYTPGKLNATYNRMMNKLSPLKGGSMFKKKSNVSQPGDASEVQADAVAKAVAEGNANAAQVELQNTVSGEGITAKASDVTIDTPPGFEEQIEKMKGGGLPLPDDKKAGLEEMLGTGLDHVRLHTGSDAADLSAQINALAFATGDDIFYPGDLNDEELLAHEVTHVVQGGENNSGLSEQKMFSSIKRSSKDTVSSSETKVGFTINIADYNPYPPNENADKSSAFAFSKIYHVTPLEAETNIRFILLNNDGSPFAGYTSDDVARGTASVSMKASLYFLGLERIAGISRGNELITEVIEEIYKARTIISNSPNGWFELADNLRLIYRKMALFSEENINALKSQYTARYNKAIESDIASIHAELNQDYTNRYYDGPHKNGKLLIAGIYVLLKNLKYESPLFNNPDQPVDDKPQGKIIMDPGAIIVTRGQTSNYGLILEQKYGAKRTYDWYVMYDVIYESESRGHIIHEKNEGIFKHVWEHAGAHKIVCIVTDTEGFMSVKREAFAIIQYVYPHIEEFADEQDERDLDAQKNVNVFSDLFDYEISASEKRLELMNSYFNLEMAKAFTDSYKNADLAITGISTNVRELNSKFTRNDFHGLEETRKYNARNQEITGNQNDAQQSNADLINDIKKNIEIYIPGVNKQPLSVLFDIKSAKSAIAKFYDVILDWGNRGDWLGKIHYTWYDEYVVHAEPFRKKSKIEDMPDKIDTNSLSDWMDVLTGFRNVVARLDEFFIMVLEIEGKKSTAHNFKFAGRMASGTAEVYEQHPDAITIPAIFYPNEQDLHLDTENAGAFSPLPQNYEASGYRIFFYLYLKDIETWELREAGSGAANTIEAGMGEGVLRDKKKVQSLFQKVDSMLRFPKGVLKFNYPFINPFYNSVEYESMEVITTSPTPMSQWLLGAGIAVGLIALTALSLGAAPIVVAALMTTSSGLLVAGNIMNMVEKDEQGLLTTEEILINLSYIATDLMTGLASGAKLISAAAKSGSSLARFAGKSFIVLNSYSLRAGNVTLMIVANDVLNQLGEISKIQDKDQRHAAYMRIAGHLLLYGMMHLVSNKFNWVYEAKWAARHPSTTGMIEIGKYKYTQDWVSKKMKDVNGKTTSLAETINEMKKNGWNFDAEPPKMVDMGSEGISSLDHRRCVAAYEAKLTEHPVELVDGKRQLSSADEGRFDINAKELNKVAPHTIPQVEVLIGRKISASDKLSLSPKNYREAAIFRSANQRIKGDKNFPLLGTYKIPYIK